MIGKLKNYFFQNAPSYYAIIGHTMHRSNCHIKIQGGRCMIGDNVFFNHNFSLTCLNEVVIQDGVTIGNNVVIVDHDHKKDRTGFNLGIVRIGRNCWIGANTVILKDTIIEDNCIIAAGSVVKGRVESNTLYIQKRNTIKNTIN